MADDVTASSNVSSKSGSGLEPKIAGLLSWLLAPVTSVIFLVIDKDSKFVKFHAWQSLIWSIGSFVAIFIITTVLMFIPIIGCIAPLLWFVPWIVSIYGAIKAYNNEMWKLPVIGDFAEKQANA